MAELQHVSNTPLSNRYHAEDSSIESRLPSGGCNYTNLASGANAARCGCKKYWDKALVGSNTNAGATGFCMCEHHACYHDGFPDKHSFAASNAQQVLRESVVHAQDGTLTAILDVEKPTTPVGMPDSMQWSRYLHGSSQGLPPIPSQCLLPSDNGSMVSGSHSSYYRPFGGQGLDTFRIPLAPAQIPKVNPMVPPPGMQIYEDQYGVQHLQSITDVATPSVRNSQDNLMDVRAHATSAAGHLQNIEKRLASQQSVALRPVSPQKAKVLSERRPETEPSRSPSLSQDQQLVLHVQPLRDPGDMPARMDNHEQRLDQLENVSFSHPAIDQVQEAQEHLEDRVGNLEHRISDLETVQLANDAGSISTRRSVEQSFDSCTSVAASATPYTELSRVEALEAQVAELQAIAPPSYSRPWEVEVVILPFGPRLAGIWSAQDAITQVSRSGSVTPRRSQTQTSSQVLGQARLVLHERATTWESSLADFAGRDTSWLMAKACGVGSKIDQRLRSRGLVRQIQIYGPDARDVEAAVLRAFGELPNIICDDPYSQQDENTNAIPRQLRSFIGLQASWIPLRKVHKDSCLRFLTPAEMVTSSSWNVAFLSSSVAMRHSGLRRLYVTQRDAYVQAFDGLSTNWTWQKLRQLPRVYNDASDAGHTPEADAQEECWQYDARLDPPPTPHTSIQSSFHSQISELSINSPACSPDHSFHEELQAEPVSPSDHFSSGPSSPDPTPRISLPILPHSPLKQRNPFRIARRRTLSMSSTIPLKGEASSQSKSQSSKRRVPSFNRDNNSSPERMTHTLEHSSSQPLRSLEITGKRRRISRSPSRPRNTPRWSVGPPSPFPVPDGDQDGGLTPFAYATPHSNSTYAPKSYGNEVNIYEDEDNGENYFVGHDDLEARDSTTDASEIEDQSYEGYEQNALSDHETAPHDEDMKHAVLDDERNGVHGDLTDSLYTEVMNQPFTKNVGGDNGRGIGDDAASDVSETPSEYPSTNQQIEQHLSEPVITLQPFGRVKAPGLYERRQKRGASFTIHVDE